MNESILISIKKLLGISEEDVNFDLDLLIHINSVLAILDQLGVGPEGGITVTDKTTVWTSVLGSNKFLALAKSYVHLKVKLLFDPPPSSAAIESINNLLSEFEWRLTLMAESTDVES